MKSRFWSRCLLLVVISITITKGESRLKKEINLIKEMILTKIFGNQNEFKSRPIFVQENFYRSPEGLLATGKEEVKIKIPKENEDPYKPEYTYKQIRSDGSAIVYTLNDKDEVIVSDTRNQPNPLDSSEYTRNKPALSSFQARLKPSKPCKADPPLTPFNPLRPMMFSVSQNPPKTPDYSYKVIQKDGSVSTYFGTGEVQEQQLREPAANINRFIQNPQLYAIDRLNSAAAPFLSRRNLVFRDEIEPVEVIDSENLPAYPLPHNEPAANLVPNEVVYLQQPSFNLPVRIKPLRIEYDHIEPEQARHDLDNLFIQAVTQQSLNIPDNSSETVERISNLVNKLAESNIEYKIELNIKNTTSPETTDNSTFSEATLSNSIDDATKYSEETTLKMSANNDEDVSVEMNTIKTNGHSTDRSRGDVPSLPN